MRDIIRKAITTFAMLTALSVVNALAVYDPNLGRWLNRDPLGEAGGINLYQFVGNNPISRIDPDGLADFNLDHMPRASDVLRGPNGYYVEYSHPDPKIIEQYAKGYMRFMGNAASFIPVEGAAVRGFNVTRNLVTKCGFFQKTRNTVLKASAARTPVQLEFPFARGASIQTPGVTIAGETFVRVGATEASTTIRAGSYAMPEATFKAIGRDPMALKNALDLPGSPPRYFRIIKPAPGTPIQRGIVPGGEFGGVGGYPEVIFPKGLK